MRIPDKLLADLMPPDVGMFTRFPPGKSECITCPPFRRDHVLKRAFWRGLLPICRIRRCPSNRTGILLLGISALVYGLIVESFIETIHTTGENMNMIISFIFVLALIGVPSYLLMEHPYQYNMPTQILFSVFLTAASTWFGIAINNKKARRDATSKWLPAAETACKQLLTLSSTAERMKRTQALACSAIDPLIPPGSADLVPIRVLVGIQCRETGEKLATLRDHIENSISHWQVFIGSNCEGDECRVIDQRLKDCRSQLFSQIDTPACTAPGAHT